jgi:hypothetical protein
MGESSDIGQITFKVAGVKKADLVAAMQPVVLRILDVREV